MNGIIKIIPLLSIVLLTVFSCTKIKDVPPPDANYRQLIIGEWQNSSLFSSDQRLVFLENGLYQEWMSLSSQGWQIIQDSIPYTIEKGFITLPHDQLGPQRHQILILSQETFRYHAENVDGDENDRMFRRLK